MVSRSFSNMTVQAIDTAEVFLRYCFIGTAFSRTSTSMGCWISSAFDCHPPSTGQHTHRISITCTLPATSHLRPDHPGAEEALPAPPPHHCAPQPWLVRIRARVRPEETARTPRQVYKRGDGASGHDSNALVLHFFPLPLRRLLALMTRDSLYME